jgi:hypothetical protein
LSCIGSDCDAIDGPPPCNSVLLAPPWVCIVALDLPDRVSLDRSYCRNLISS